MHRLPGAESVALSSGFPIELGGGGGRVGVSPDQPSRGYYSFMVSTPEVFGTWGVQIPQGRGFDDRDTAGSERVAVLTERMAREFFPNGTAIGRQIFIQFSQVAGEPVPPVETVTVIGIAAASETDREMLPAFDPLIVALVPVAFIVAAIIAAYVPARRASRVDPNVALRHL